METFSFFVGKAALHWSCRMTTKSVKHFLPKFGKKWFKQEGLKCSFCLKKGHTNYFCPLAPYVPPAEDKLPFVERLLALPRVKTNGFIKSSMQDALARIKSQGQGWNVGNPWENSDKIFDRLRAQLGYWKAIGASNSVISWLGYGVPMKFEKEPDHRAFPNHRMDEEAKAYMDKDMKKHLTSGCFVPAPRGSVLVCNPILVIEQNGKHRRCDDCRHANAKQASPKFSLGSLKKDIPMLAKPGDIGLTRDLEKAYYKVPLSKEASRYTAFSWGGKFFLSMVMLFGMCQAPLFFTRICKPIARILATLRIPALNYIDDWFWALAKGTEEPIIQFITDLFGLLGWSFNDKGEQGERVKLLGFVIDMVLRKFVIPNEKREATVSMLKEHALMAASGKGVMMDVLRRTMGRVISMSLGEPGVKTWCRSLFTQIVETEGKGTAMMSLTSIEELNMLILLLSLSEGSPIVSPVHDMEIWTDAGEVGWGGHTIDNVSVSGQFENKWIGTSSTARELKGLILVLEALEDQVRGMVVRLNMDSRCSVRNIMKSGGPVPELCDLVKALWHLCKGLKVELVPIWQSRDVAGMVKADSLSKVGTLWKMRVSFRVMVEEKYGVGVEMPDVADSKKTVISLARGLLTHAVVLPRWEGQAWWGTLESNTTDMIDVGDMSKVVEPNMYGYPRWDFVLCLVGN